MEVLQDVRETQSYGNSRRGAAFLILISIISPLLLYLSIVVTDLRVLLIKVKLDNRFEVWMIRLVNAIIVEIHVAVIEPALG